MSYKKKFRGNKSCFTVPLKLKLQKQYWLNVLKEFTTTDSFMTLDVEDRECENESLYDCNTRKFKEALINKCQCLPFQMISNNEVYKV